MAPPTAAVTGITQVHVHCHDVPRAVAFYRDVLGLPFLFESGGLAFFQCGATRLMLSRSEDAALAHPSSIVYFTTADIQASVAALAHHGVPASAPHVIARVDGRDVWLCDWRDSEDNVMAFMEQRPAAG